MTTAIEPSSSQFEGSLAREQRDGFGHWVMPARVRPSQIRALWGRPLNGEVSSAVSAADELAGISADDYITRPISIANEGAQSPQFHVLQKWEGRVLEVHPDSFTAVVLDLGDRKTEEEVEFDLTELSEYDLPLLAPGAVFYWSIGYRVDVNRTKSRSSLIRLRRLPVWSKRDLRQLDDRLAELKRDMDW